MIGGGVVIGQTGSASVAVLYSGGLDSSILLARLLAEGHRVRPLLVDCQWRWQRAELHGARRFLAALAQERSKSWSCSKCRWRILYADHWSFTGQGVPGAEAPDPEVYLPGHNPLLLVKAHVWCHLHGVGRLALGTLRRKSVCRCHARIPAAVRVGHGPCHLGPRQLVRPLAQFEQARSDAPGPRAAAGAHLFVPGTGRGRALRRV